jgi:exosortase/archaeosortase family protein
MVMGGFSGLILLMYREDLIGTLLAPFTLITAQTTLELLQWSGMEAVRVATRIYHPNGFAYEIYYRCTGFLPVALLAIAILAYPRSMKHKLWGLAVGVSVLLVLNLTRLVHLFYVGVYDPAAFNLTHTVYWQGFIILVTICLWWGWVRWRRSQ